MELDLQIVLGLGDPADLIDEVHVPRGAAVFAVGHALEAEVLLHPDDVADGGVLDLAPVGGRDPAGREIGSGLKNIRGTQKAADMVGSERRQLVHAEMARLEA